MEKDTIFGVLFKSNSKAEKKFEDFSQLTPAGKRLMLVKWDAPIFEWSNLIIVSVHEKRKPVKCLLCDADISLKSNSINHIFRRCSWKESVRVLFDLLVSFDFKNSPSVSFGPSSDRVIE